MAQQQMKTWNVRVHRYGVSKSLGQVHETSEDLARCAALSKFGLSGEEAEEGARCDGIYPADDFDVSLALIKGERAMSTKNYERTNVGTDWANSAGVSSRPFGIAFLWGVAKITGLLACVFACWELVYALGWGCAQLLTQGCAECSKLPTTAWFFASDSSGMVIVVGVGAIIAIGFIGMLVVAIALAGGWSLPASWRGRREVHG